MFLFCFCVFLLDLKISVFRDRDGAGLRIGYASEEGGGGVVFEDFIFTIIYFDNTART